MESSFPPKYQKLIREVRDTGKLVPFLALLSKFGIGGEEISAVVKGIESIKDQVDDLVEFTVSFQDAFSEQGWLFSESTNVETARKALHAYQNGNPSKAESLLATDFEGEGLDYLVVRMCHLEVFMERKEQLVESADLTREGRYLAATPLLLIVADGVGSDAFGKSVFAEGVDLEELNSLAGRPDALPELICNICTTRRKTSSERLEFPFRNGIIHGRDLGYGNRLVNAKCWSLLANIADVIEARNAEDSLKPEPEPSLRDIFETLARTDELKQRTHEWVRRPVIDKPIVVSEESKSSMDDEPERALAEFLQAWKVKNYGRMAQMTLFFDELSIKKHAGEIRRLLEEVTLVGAVIARIEDEAPAVTEIAVDLTFRSDCKEFVNEYVFRMICQDGKGGAAVRGHLEAQWLILKGFQYQGWSETRSPATE